MTNPAVEAAQRAIGHVSPDEFTNEVGDTALASAREALKPIQKLHEQLTREADDEHGGCESGMRYVLRELAPLIFTSEELER